MTSITDPICTGCDGYGKKLINFILNQRSIDPCDECNGAGRVSPGAKMNVISTDEAAKQENVQPNLPGDDVTLEQPA